ncbi:PHO85 cyclin-1 [Coemansia sp. RSA 2399]|nr:PHO85 cyclin-1 [Coemansia sp. RSA 2399]KAJ1903112.1 PHO85 cyclin-1 [Coemansia sp. IMI 209127]
MLAASNGNSGTFGGDGAHKASMMATVAAAAAATAAVTATTRTPNIHTLYHIPQTLTTFTVNFLSQLFAAVEKPQAQLKRPDITVDTRRFPEFRYFIRTLLINGRISADTLVHALIYLSRFHRRVAGQQAHVEEGAKHKLFLAALLVASKFCDDRYPLATISVCEFLPPGLLTLTEINRMERAFLKVIKYKLVVDPNELALLLGKHGIDIKQIANAISERLGHRVSAAASAATLQRLSVPMILSASSIPQRAVAGHSISARTVGSAVLSTSSHPSNATVAAIGNEHLIHSAQLETIAMRGPRRMSKPLPLKPM